MTAPLTLETTIETALRAHPAMLDAFVRAGFKPLTNPVLRRLLAPVVTLRGAARKKGWDDARLIAFLEEINQIARTPVIGAVCAEPEGEAVPDGPAPERHPWGLFLDNRGLVPPQPMVRILTLLPTLGSAERLVAHNDREPVMLLPRLAEDGYAYTLEHQPDGSCRTTIWRE